MDWFETELARDRDRAGRPRIPVAAQINRFARVRGSFTLRSGATSDTDFDKYRFESHPLLLRQIAEEMEPLVPEHVALLAGLELGGIPVAVMLSQITGLHAVFVRKQAKTYGTCRLAEGAEITGRPLAIVEDVVSTGGQIIESTRQLRAFGAQVDVALCVIDRETGGRENLAAERIELRSLLRASELES